MVIIPLQPFGIGDIIFTQTLVRTIANGNPILWPVFPQFVDQLNRAYPDVAFVNWLDCKVDYDCKEQREIMHNGAPAVLLPIRWADSILKVPYSQCMRAKYDLYGLDYREWKRDAMWVRSEDKDLRAIKPGEYNFVNNNFGSDAALHTYIITTNGLPNVFMEVLPEYSLFDWSRLIVNATEIHTVSTSIIYLLEMLDLKAKEVHLYPRKPIEQDFRNVEYLLQKHKYVLHA